MRWLWLDLLDRTREDDLGPRKVLLSLSQTRMKNSSIVLSRLYNCISIFCGGEEERKRSVIMVRRSLVDITAMLP
jgi:hypothetical protein